LEFGKKLFRVGKSGEKPKCEYIHPCAMGELGKPGEKKWSSESIIYLGRERAYVEGEKDKYAEIEDK
jgi:hypothetical protein